METSVVEFNFEGLEVRTIVGSDGEPWFVARDVCNILELNNLSEAMKGLDEDDLTSVKLMSGVQTREMKIISEPGLYTLVLRCRETTTKGSLPYRFRRWWSRR